MRTFKITMLSILGLLVLMVLAVGLGLFDLEWQKYFQPRHEDVRREVFENTQSYVHGKLQELSDYYEQYNQAETEDDKQVIANVIKVKFAEFDDTKITNSTLRVFLINTRGF